MRDYSDIFASNFRKLGVLTATGALLFSGVSVAAADDAKRVEVVPSASTLLKASRTPVGPVKPPVAQSAPAPVLSAENPAEEAAGSPLPAADAIAPETIPVEVHPTPIPDPVDHVLDPVENMNVSNDFGLRYGVNPLLGADVPELHNGLDIAAPTGTHIRAIASGTVTTVINQDPQGLGWYGGLRTVIDHGNGVQSTYSHQNEQWVHEGQHVEKGDIIGAVGTTGNSTGAHLHFEINVNGTDVDPAPILAE